MLSLIIPFYNSAASAEGVLKRLLEFLEGHFTSFEVIAVDDGSPDSTVEKIRTYSARDPRVVLVSFKENRGKGAAVKAGVEASKGEVIIFTDADLPYRLEDIPVFAEALSSGFCDLVLGTRYEGGEGRSSSVRGAKRSMLSRLFVFFTSFVLPKPVSDTQCGFKGFTREAARAIFGRLSTFRFAFDVEAIAIAQQLGLRIKMQPVSLVNQGDSSVRVGRDGLRMIFDLAYIFFKVRSRSLKRIFPFLLVILLAPAFLYLNIFGNQPDALADESYFLTSALSAIEKRTLPGWEFSASGAYYGGVQAYLGTALLLPVLGTKFALEGFSVTGLGVWVATHTGDLMHILRLLNGLLLFGMFVAIGWYFLRPSVIRVPRELSLRLGLLLILLLGNPLVVMLAHTAKIWVLYLVLELAAATLVLVQEYYLRVRGETFMRTPLYVGLLIWIATLAFFQTYVGVATTGLWLVWAWWLGHFKLREVYEHLRRYWYLFLLFAATQVSFLWRAFVERPHGSTLLDFGGFTTPGEGGASNILWAHRILAPLQDAFASQPLLILFPLLAILLLFARYRGFLGGSWRYYFVALVHPLWAYIAFYLLLGFDVAPRYAVLLATAVSIAIVMLIPLRGLAYKAVACLGGVLAAIVLFHSVTLYWSPTYQSVLTDRIVEEMGNRSDVTLVVDQSAVAYQLPMNARSLERLEERDRSLGRYAYLLSNLVALDGAVSFKPLVLYTHTPESRQAALERASRESSEVYLISLPEGTENSAEPSVLAVFLSTKRLGQAYVIERVYP